MSNIIQELKAKELRGELEVEDLLCLVHTSIDTSELQQLKEEFGWIVQTGENEIPFAEWLDVVCTYLNEGYLGLLKLVESDEQKWITFVLAVLEELKTIEALEVVLNFLNKYIDVPNIILANLCFGSINLMISFDEVIKLSDSVKSILNGFIEKYLDLYDQLPVKEELLLVNVYCAWRRSGNEYSIKLIKGRKKIELPDYVGLENVIIKAIKKWYKPN